MARRDSKRSEAAGTALERQRRRVLVIEDSIDVAETLRIVLAMLGHDVQVAYDGPSGLAVARQFNPDVVFCDIGMSGMDGYEVARAFRRDEACGATLVALTGGRGRPQDIELALDAGFDAHVSKPPSVEDLRRAALTQRSSARPTRAHADEPPQQGGCPG